MKETQPPCFVPSPPARPTRTRPPHGSPAHVTARPRADSLPAAGAEIAARLREYFAPAALPIQQVLALAEEAGEFTAAYRRWAGMARRTGTWDHVEAELANVVITAYVTAAVLGIDLDAAARAKTAVIFTRGWRQPPPAA